MSIFLSRDTRLVIQGMGRTGQLHAGLSQEFGTNVVAGVTPGRGGSEAGGVPVFDTVSRAVELARNEGCHLVQLTTDKRRQEALRFYERLGFKASHEGMKLHL